MNIIQETYAWANSLTPRPLSGVIVEVVHHSAGALTETVAEIHAQHLAQGWSGIGYTFVIYPDGSIHTGRPMRDVPAATEGFNTESVAVCLIGNFEPGSDGYTGSPTPEQINSLVDISVYIHENIPSISATKGHRDFNSTACPGENLYNYLPTLRTTVAIAMQGHPSSSPEGNAP